MDIQVGHHPTQCQACQEARPSEGIMNHHKLTMENIGKMAAPCMEYMGVFPEMVGKPPTHPF